MLSFLVGQVDWNAAAVLIAVFITVCIVITTAIAKRRSKLELEMQFEVDKQKLRNENDQAKRLVQRELEISLAKIATERDVNFKRIESGLIEGKVN